MNSAEYDESIWKEIGGDVERRARALRTTLLREVVDDHSPKGLPDLQQILGDRAESWVQRHYEMCCAVYKNLGKEISIDFDRVVWSFCIQPFILDEPRAPDGSIHAPGLIELLLWACGAWPEGRKRQSSADEQWGLTVRLHIWDAWQKKLLHLRGLTQAERAAAALASYEADELRAWGIGNRSTNGPAPEPSTSIPDAPLPSPKSVRHETPSRDELPVGNDGLAVSKKIEQELPTEQHPPLPRKLHDFSDYTDSADLTDLQDQCFSLKFEYELPVIEIARRLGRDRKTIQEHIDSAKKKIDIARMKHRSQKTRARSGIE